MKALIVLFLGGLMTLQLACKATKALDATIEMNADMKKMLNKMDTTNNNMKGMDNTVGKTNSGMDQMLDFMKSSLGPLKDDIKLLKLKMGLEQIFQKDYIHPSQAFAGAQLFAEHATPDQIIDITMVYIKAIEGAEGELELNEKLSYAYGIVALAYNTPEHKVDQIIEKHIVGQSHRIDTAYSFMAYRTQLPYKWLQGYLWAPYSEGKGTEDQRKQLTNLSELKEALDYASVYFKSFEFPFAQEIYHNTPKEYKFDLREPESDKRKYTLEAVKYVIEQWIDCQQVATADGMAQLNDMIVELTPAFEKYQVATPDIRSRCQ